MSKNNVNALSEEQLGGVSGGADVMGMPRLTQKQMANLDQAKKANDGGMGYLDLCQQYGCVPETQYLTSGDALKKYNQIYNK